MALSIICAAVFGVADYGIDDVITYRVDSPLPANAFLRLEPETGTVTADTTAKTSYCATLFGVVPLKHVSVRQYENIRLCPGGMPFGAKLFTEGLIVVGFTDIDCTSGSPHPASDSETGALMPLSRGIVIDVTISGIQKGQSGVPGELKGHFASGKIGSLLGNTHAGVYGFMTEIPQGISDKNALPIALKNEIRDGDATLLCTLDDGGICSYTVSIRKLKNSLDNKNMEITVTDPALLEKTGGIVQGMSGSPIIQNGKLIGAVTHVLINDPTKGYGIFIENMLASAG